MRDAIARAYACRLGGRILYRIGDDPYAIRQRNRNGHRHIADGLGLARAER
jgi:hypothetical protein